MGRSEDSKINGEKEGDDPRVIACVNINYWKKATLLQSKRP